MVNNVVNATYVETYDLKTTIGKITIMGIHTPTALSLKKMYKGFFEQYKKIKINSCDIVGVCASTQSLTPNEVGMEAGKTSPREVLDPILFKACTGENLNLLLDQIYGTSGSDIGSIHRMESATDADRYYAMLADDTFRKFHPQGGVRVSSLKPFVHKVASTQPFKWEVGGNNVPNIGNTSSSGAGNQTYGTGFGGSNGSAAQVPSVFISNGIEPMPWLETTFEGTEEIIDGEGATETVVSTVLATNIPRCYCGVLVLPPAEYTSLYFRFSVRWHVSFKDFRPAYEIGPLGSAVGSTDIGFSSGNLYYNLYNVSSKLDAEYGSFDANGVESAELTFVKGH